MTKRRYDKRTRLSRSPTERDTFSDLRRRGREASRAGAFSGAFEALQPDSAEHPVDVIVDRVPLIATLSRDLVRTADKIKRQLGKRQAFVAYEDLRLHVRTEREVAYYNIGHAHGQVVGRVDSLAVRSSNDPQANALFRAVHVAVLQSTLPPRQVSSLLLEISRAYVLGLKTAGPSKRSAR